MTQHTVGDNLLGEIRWAIDQVRRLVRGKPEDQPPDPPRAPDGYIALIPEGGIPARNGDTLYSADCQIYREVTAGTGAKSLEKILGEYGAPWTLPVFNPHCQAMPGGYQATTDLLKGGTRIVDELLAPCSSSSSDSSGSSPSSDSSASSDTPSSSSAEPPAPPGSIWIHETDTYCVQGILQVWRRPVYLILTAGVLTKTEGTWFFDHAAGCCDCGSSGSSESSVSSDSPSSGSETPCDVGCWWQWSPDYDGTWYWWHDYTIGCVVPNCGCSGTPEPSRNGAYPYERVVLPCVSVPSSSSPSSSEISSSVSPSSDSPAPSSDAPSSSSSGGCFCDWYWNGIVWYQMFACENFGGQSCAGTCTLPETDGAYYGEIRTMPCGGNSSTSSPDSSVSAPSSDSSAGSGTSSATPSSDTGTSSGSSAASTCMCNWIWNNITWFQITGCIQDQQSCAGTCIAPTGTGSYYGEARSVPCFAVDSSAESSATSSADSSSSEQPPFSSGSSIGSGDINYYCDCQWQWNAYYHLWMRHGSSACQPIGGYPGPCAGACIEPNWDGAYDGQLISAYCYGA